MWTSSQSIFFVYNLTRIKSAKLPIKNYNKQYWTSTKTHMYNLQYESI